MLQPQDNNGCMKMSNGEDRVYVVSSASSIDAGVPPSAFLPSFVQQQPSQSMMMPYYGVQAPFPVPMVSQGGAFEIRGEDDSMTMMNLGIQWLLRQWTELRPDHDGCPQTVRVHQSLDASVSLPFHSCFVNCSTWFEVLSGESIRHS